MEQQGGSDSAALAAWDGRSLDELDRLIKAGDRKAWLSPWGDRRRRLEAESNRPDRGLGSVLLLGPAGALAILVILPLLVARWLYRVASKEGH